MESSSKLKIRGDGREQQNKEGFYCDVCDCIVKDSLNYLDHINGKRHNRNLGISLKKFKDSTLEEVQEMLELKKRERDEREAGFAYDKYDDEKIRRLRREKKKRQRARKAGLLDDDDGDNCDTGKNIDQESDENGEDTNDAEQNDKEDDDEEATEEDMARIMGFGSFSTSKKWTCMIILYRYM